MGENGREDCSPSEEAEGITNRIIELQINNFKKKCQSYSNDQSISTPKLAAFGITDCYIQFYPKGSFWCTKEGHFSMIFGCPSNIDVDIVMYAGAITNITPKLLMTNEDINIYGLHDFGDINQIVTEPSGDAVAVGVEFRSIVFKDANTRESDNILRVTND